MSDPDLAAAKVAARKAAYARRKLAFGAAPQGAADQLRAVLSGYRGVPLSGFLAIRTEIDPLPAMTEAAAHGPVGVPVIPGKAVPLRFALWTPGCRLVSGVFGTVLPADPQWIEPEILIVPLLAFSATGGRLGYGGGYYDRTLQMLRAKRPTIAIGFAFAAQQDDSIPLEPTDQPLDLIVTERGVLRPGAGTVA